MHPPYKNILTFSNQVENVRNVAWKFYVDVFSFAFLKRSDHMQLGKEGVYLAYLSPSLSTGGCQGRNHRGALLLACSSGLVQLAFVRTPGLQWARLSTSVIKVPSFIKDDPTLYHVDKKLRITASMDQ